MNNLLTLFRPSFWFDLQPLGFSPLFEQGFFLLFALLIILGCASRIAARHRKDDRFMKKTYRYLGQLFLTMGIAGMVWFFLTFEQIYLFGARFWFLFWLIGFVAWGWWIYRYVNVTVPQLKQQGKEKNQDQQYLPRKKRRA
jgi:glucan phosphoethanolaminetransferase (alkaline phosphatase superfamily)